MKKLIEFDNPQIVCDNPDCDYRTNYAWSSADELLVFLNVPCPLCGNSLLTPADYFRAKMVINRVNWINKWFGWVTVFTRNKNKGKVLVKTHNEVAIIKIT